jgi:nicotinate-nucleotide adenylyltransferase
MNITIYSGSFNPVHNGHLALANYILEQNISDEVWFVISPCNPLKNQNELIDEYLRLDMVILSIKNQAGLKASDVEFTMPIPSYSIDTLSKLSTDFPAHTFSLLIGSDNALVFDKWKDYSELLRKYKVYVYPRTGYDFSDVAHLYPQMKLLDTAVCDVSATEIRLALQQNNSVSELIHPDVLRYILENNLYQ